MAKELPTQSAAPGVKFRKCPMMMETLKKYGALLSKMIDFQEVKKNKPMAKFGSTDYPFTGKGVFGTTVPGLAHAHLTKDISIVYRVHSKNPTLIDLYGLYSHADLGTGQPANIKRQKSIATKFSNQEFS